MSFKHFFLPPYRRRVYLDHASATPLDGVVEKAMRKHLQNGDFGNPASIHKDGRKSKALVEECRRDIARLLGVHSDEIIFTSGGTESNNLAIIGAVRKAELKKSHVITSVIEHSSILKPIQVLLKEGLSATYLPVNKEGRISIESLINSIRAETILISIAKANGEIGTIERIREIAQAIKSLRAETAGRQFPYFHVDASQAANFLSVRPNDLNADLLTLDASKIYGPKGIGLLYIKRGVLVAPIIYGGGQERGFRSGTENVLGIVGFRAALKQSIAVRKRESARLTPLRDYFIERLLATIPGASINGEGERLPNTINLSINNVDAEFLSVRLDAQGISASSASACRSISDKGSSYVIEALPEREGCGKNSLRFTLGRPTKKRDIDYTVKTLKALLS